MKFGISINANEDLNNLTEIGTYYSTSSTITASLTNCPMSTYGFFMIVSYATGTDPMYIRQTIYGRTDSLTPIMYVRHKSSSEWGEWCSFSDDATVMNEITSYVPTITESNSDINIGDYAYVYVRKFGRICSIQFNVKGSINTANKFITLFTLNKGYRPVNNIQHNYITQNGVVMLLNVISSGEVQIYCADNTETGNWIIRQCITFICDS